MCFVDFLYTAPYKMETKGHGKIMCICVCHVMQTLFSILARTDLPKMFIIFSKIVTSQKIHYATWLQKGRFNFCNLDMFFTVYDQIHFMMLHNSVIRIVENNNSSNLYFQLLNQIMKRILQSRGSNLITNHIDMKFQVKINWEKQISKQEYTK